LNRALAITQLCIASFGGLLALPAVPIAPYFWFVPVPILYSCIAYRMLSAPETRKIFVVTAAVEFAVGIAIGQLFFRNGSVSAVGILLMLAAFAGSAVSLREIWVAESEVTKNASADID